MLKIGDFSRLARVTVKTLRHYAEIGLLKPSFVDRFTGYRYYALNQLPRLNRILALKDLGLSLEQIARVIDGELTASEMRGMLSLKQAELQQKLQAEQMRLARVEARLRQIEQEGAPVIEAVALRSLEGVPVASMRDTAAIPEAVAALRLKQRKIIEGWLGRDGLHASGPWMALYSNLDYVERDVPVETALVLPALPARLPLYSEGINVFRLPAQSCAAVLAHTGGSDTLPQAYAALYAWAETNAYRPSGFAREVYLGENGEEVIEVQLPVEPVGLPGGQKQPVVEPEIVEYREFLVSGILSEGDRDSQEIAAMWSDTFLPRIGEIKRPDPYVTYGVSDISTMGWVRYLAGAEITQPEDCPAGMTLWRIPAGRYAIFRHIGALDTLAKTYEYIYQHWLPASPYHRADRPDIEVYTEEFHGFQPDSVLYLYVPIEAK